MSRDSVLRASMVALERKKSSASALAKPLGFHAWRRCHAEQMVALGAASGELAAQMALDHAHGSTTRQFYANSRAMLVDRLPNLIVADEHADQMRLFS